MLALLELHVGGGWIVRVSVPEEGRAVGGEGGQLALVGVDVGFEVSEALVYFRAGGGGDVLLLETHLAELLFHLSVRSMDRYGNGAEDINGQMEGWRYYQLVGFLEGSLGGADGGFARLAAELGDLVEFLGQVGLDELEFGFVAAEELGAGVGVERVGHDGYLIVVICGWVCSKLSQRGSKLKRRVGRRCRRIKIVERLLTRFWRVLGWVIGNVVG